MANPLHWHQGLFLQPQHLQLSDLYIQSLVAPLYKLLRPHLWGVVEIEIQEAALGNYSFNLLSGEFLFPDNTYVTLPGNAVLESRLFDKDWVEGGKPFKVYLGLKKWNDYGENVTVTSSLDKITDVTTRFVTTADPEDFPDLHQGGPTGQVECLSFALKIFWHTEQDALGDYILLPLVQLEKSGEEIILAKHYIPPCLTISSSESLFKLIKEIRDQIASRGNQLESYKRERGIHTAEFGSRDMVYLLALRSLNRYTPLLYHMTEQARVHPWEVYGLVRQLIGELSSFSESINAVGEDAESAFFLAGYDHRDLWTCFDGARLLVTRLLDEITAGPEHIVLLPFDGTYFSAELSPSMFDGPNRFYLVFETEKDPQATIESLGAVAKLSSRETLPILIARSLPGIKLDYLQVPPQELPRRARSMYFQIHHHSEQWAQIQNNYNIAIYWDDAPEDLKVELMIVGRS